MSLETLMAERILLVDDHPLTRSALAGLLTQHGFDVVGEAADGEEAIEAAGRLRSARWSSSPPPARRRTSSARFEAARPATC
jgi:CheY-like chemotaxis protein